MPKSVNIVITNCMHCPHVDHDRTQGAGYAIDYFCKLVEDKKADYGYKLIAGYVESHRDEPQDGKIPDWCPLAINHR